MKKTVELNKWQKVYIDYMYNGKMPRSKIGKQEVELLGKVKKEIIVHFPDFKGINGVVPAHTEKYLVTEHETNMPEGLISVDCLASNLVLWLSRDYKVETV